VTQVDDRTEPAAAGRPPGLPEVEAFLCGVWCELLGVGGEVADGDFFGLGGHSFLAIEVIARLKDSLGIDVPFWLIFESPTPRLLADRVVHFERE